MNDALNALKLPPAADHIRGHGYIQSPTAAPAQIPAWQAANAFYDTLGLQRNIAALEKPVKHDNTLDLSHYDISFFNDVAEGVPVIGTNMRQGLEMVKTFRNLSEDIFLDLFKYNPKIRDKSEINASRHFNYDLMEQLREHKAYQGLQKVCKLDEFSAALGASSLQKVAIEKIHEYIENHKSKQERQSQNGSSGQSPGGQPDPSMIDLINQLSDQEERDTFGGMMPQPANNGGSGNDNGLIDDIQDSNGDNNGQSNQQNSAGGYMTDEAAQKLAEMQAQRQYERMTASIANEISKAATDIHKELDELNEFVQAWGLDSDSTKSRISFESKREAVERIRRSKELRNLTKVLGRFKAIARNKLKERSIGTGNTIHSVTVGGRIDKLLPSELATLANEGTKPHFYKKLHEKQLLQYETSNDKRKGMGPIIVCEDISGSMDGNRTMWARAVTLSLLEIAQRQNRDFSIVFFDTEIVAEFTVLKKGLDPKTLVDIAEIGSGGGTDFKKPTYRAIDIVEKARRFRKADVVFITDGDCHLTADDTNRLISMKKRLNVKIQTILIGTGNSRKGSVKAWSDSIQTIDRIADMNADVAENIFANTISDIGPVLDDCDDEGDA